MKVFRTCWAIYGITLYFIILTLQFPFYFLAFLILPVKWRKYMFWINHQVVTPIYLALIGVRVKVKGKHLVDWRKTYIIVSNHVTLLDFLINGRAYPGIYKFLAKKELARVPIFGFIVAKHCVLVDRSSNASRMASIKYLSKTLDEGYSVFLYPEGTRNKGPEPLLPFYKGAFKMAIETGTPVAVQTMVDAEKVAGRARSLDLCPGTTTVIWDKPIPVEGMTVKDVDFLSEKVRKLMLSHLAHGNQFRE